MLYIFQTEWDPKGKVRASTAKRKLGRGTYFLDPEVILQLTIIWNAQKSYFLPLKN